jgi:sortase A
MSASPGGVSPEIASPAAAQSEWSEGHIRAYARSLIAHPLAIPRAVLRIPSVKLSVPVYADASADSLNRGAGLISGTAGPQTAGNMGIAAHRDSFFRALRHVALGDRLEIDSLSGTRVYRVSALYIVNPDDTRPLLQTDRFEVTLVTCYPFYYLGSAPQRYIVRAIAIACATAADGQRADAPAFATPAVDAPSCADLSWQKQILARYPSIAAACQEVVVSNAIAYARFTGELVRVNRDGSVKFDFKDRNGKSLGEPTTLQPADSQRAVMEGRAYRLSELRPGQQLSVYVPEMRLAVATEPGAPPEAVAKMVFEDPQPTVVQARVDAIARTLWRAGADWRSFVDDETRRAARHPLGVRSDGSGFCTRTAENPVGQADNNRNAATSECAETGTRGLQVNALCASSSLQ